MMTDQYKAAGVDIDEGNRAVALMKDAVRSTFTAQVLTDVGAFGGLFALENLPDDPVLVASTDGVGTKVKLAADLGAFGNIGHDIVNHCINDILVQGARPLFFLDYIASSRLIPEQVAAIVAGMAEACRAAGCALLGGETAEMPGVYSEGAFDVAGTVVGIVGKGDLLPRTDAMEAGDILIGFPSSGAHTNGYSLIRRLVAGYAADGYSQPLSDGRSLSDALIAPHRCYLNDIDLLRRNGIPLRGMAHITGGGFFENIPRVLPATLSAKIIPGSWNIPPLFTLLIELGQMAEAEAFRVFNMGIGMVVIVEPIYSERILALLPGTAVIGHLTAGTKTLYLAKGNA